jgi:hypothetical protein
VNQRKILSCWTATARSYRKDVERMMMTSPNPPWAREASNLAASCEEVEVERRQERERLESRPVYYRRIRGVSNLPATFLLNSFLSKLAPLTT